MPKIRIWSDSLNLAFDHQLPYDNFSYYYMQTKSIFLFIRNNVSLEIMIVKT